MRILVFSPIRLFAEGLALCLEDDASVEAAVCCCRADTIVETVGSFAPDVVLVDTTTEGWLQEGRALATACPDVPIIALALAEACEEVIACADAGFIGYVPREAPLSRLRTIIAMALRGEVACNPKVSSGLLRELRARRMQARGAPQAEPLTRREADVLRLLGRGMANKQIARQLCLSEATVKTHIHSIFAKLRVHRRAEALARLRNEPWIASAG